MLLLLETNFLHLILPVAFLLVRVGWPPPLPRTHPFHRGEGGWWVMTMTMAGGVGGGPGTWNIYYWENQRMEISDNFHWICPQVMYCLGWCYILTPLSAICGQVLLPTQVSSFGPVPAVIMKFTSWSKQAGFWTCSKTEQLRCPVGS